VHHAPVTVRRAVAAVVLLAIGAAMALSFVLLVGGDDDDPKDEHEAQAETTTTIARPDATTDPAAAELFDLVSAFGEKTLHARYELAVTARPDTEMTVELWQLDGEVRQDAEVRDSTGTTRLALLDLTERTILCQQPPGGAFTCGLINATEATAFDSLRVNLLAELADQEVEVRDDTIDEQPVRCFTVASATTSELCVTEDGIIATITAPEGSFELIEADGDVDASVFTPPAEPAAA
jgi:hypothetical protein